MDITPLYDGSLVQHPWLILALCAFVALICLTIFHAYIVTVNKAWTDWERADRLYHTPLKTLLKNGGKI